MVSLLMTKLAILNGHKSEGSFVPKGIRTSRNGRTPVLPHGKMVGLPGSSPAVRRHLDQTASTVIPESTRDGRRRQGMRVLPGDFSTQGGIAEAL